MELQHRQTSSRLETHTVGVLSNLKGPRHLPRAHEFCSQNIFTILKRTMYDQFLQIANVLPQRHNARDSQYVLLSTIRSQGCQTNSQLSQKWHGSQRSNIIIIVERALVNVVSQLQIDVPDKLPPHSFSQQTTKLGSVATDSNILRPKARRSLSIDCFADTQQGQKVSIDFVLL